MSAKTQEKRVFVLQGNDKLKIESLKVNGSCSLFVDLYTPCGEQSTSCISKFSDASCFNFRIGIKETSDFMMYTADKPDLWKAYQFCAERQLVFHLKHTGKGTKNDGEIFPAPVIYYNGFHNVLLFEFVFHVLFRKKQFTPEI